MVWSALLAGGLSLLSGFGAQQSAKKQAKTQAAHDLIARLVNEENIRRDNEVRANLAKDVAKKAKVITKKLEKTPLVQKTETKGSVTSSRTSDSKTDNYSYVDTEGMMKAAEAAGFNPVTFLNAGGLQAYTQTGSRTTLSDTQTDITDMLVTNTTTGHNAGLSAQIQSQTDQFSAQLASPTTYQMSATQVGKIPSTMEVIGDAGTAALNAYRQDEARQNNQDFQREMLNTQLAAIQKASGANKFGGGFGTVPSMSTSGGTTVTGGGGLTPKVGTVTNPWAGVGGVVSPSWPDAETVENRYAEGVSIPYGIIGGFNDATRNVFGKDLRDFFNMMNNPGPKSQGGSWWYSPLPAGAGSSGLPRFDG